MKAKTREESRVFPVLTVVALVLLLVLLPGRYRLLPPGVPILCGLVFVAPMVAVAFDPANALRQRVERSTTLVLVGFVVMLDLLILTRLLVDMIGHSKDISPLTLLSTAVAVWTANFISFAFLYWQIDRGGPAIRAHGWSGRADFTFTHGDERDGVPEDWQPAFADYLFLAYNTSTAFSPTDTLPVRARAKMLMMAQSAISLVTLLVVAARAINVLGS